MPADFCIFRLLTQNAVPLFTFRSFALQPGAPKSVSVRPPGGSPTRPSNVALSPLALLALSKVFLCVVWCLWVPVLGPARPSLVQLSLWSCLRALWLSPVAPPSWGPIGVRVRGWVKETRVRRAARRLQSSRFCGGEGRTEKGERNTQPGH